ncbi:plasmid-related protein [Candidatus Symbiobacter mobilis CR]|uniref:Plasmid-related protein n=2 Tax=Candidatus Symbiobacter TaxID=1436289 RepID=U5N3X2_9BURK|nr:plasmid-related protein [Candidatus Symbiobacter mobilis CR]
MGWTDSHLHVFETGDRYYGVLDPEWDDDEGIYDETKFRLNQLLWYEKDYLKYVYDLGDEWEHKITLEKILPFNSKVVLPFCVKAKGACPLEDVGGLWGYYKFLEIMRNPNHPEYEEYKKWIGGEFDPTAYDIDEVNALLADIGR